MHGVHPAPHHHIQVKDLKMLHLFHTVDREMQLTLLALGG